MVSLGYGPGSRDVKGLTSKRATNVKRIVLCSTCTCAVRFYDIKYSARILVVMCAVVVTYNCSGLGLRSTPLSFVKTPSLEENEVI